jgi:hypothetical protein
MLYRTIIKDLLNTPPQPIGIDPILESLRLTCAYRKLKILNQSYWELQFDLGHILEAFVSLYLSKTGDLVNSQRTCDNCTLFFISFVSNLINEIYIELGDDVNLTSLLIAGEHIFDN